MNGRDPGGGQGRVARPTLRAEDRLDVLWIGDSPPRVLDGVCGERDLVLRKVTPTELREAAPQARMLLMEVPLDDLDFLHWGEQVVREALEHGLAVGLILQEDDHALPRVELAVAQPFYEIVCKLKLDATRVEGIYRRWDRVAQWAVQHRPGPGENALLQFEGSPPDDPAARVLLRRAFHDFTTVTLTPLGGGKSGASVWMVTPGAEDRGRRAHPFVAKLHDLEKMRAERSNYALIRGPVSNRLHAAFHEERWVEGEAHGVVVYDLVANAVPLRSLLPVTVPATLIASLFEGTLAGCLASPTPVTASITKEFGPTRLKALRWSPDLRVAAGSAQERDPTLPGVDELRARVEELPALTYRTATVHGDLHLGNLFIACNSTDVILIDYGNVSASAPLVADPACLEVSLGFPSLTWDTPNALAYLSEAEENWLRSVYQYPLTPQIQVRLGGDEWICTATRAVRSAVQQHEPDPVPYAIAVAAYLIRYASFEGHAALQTRALAYELACGLLEGVERELAGRGAVEANMGRGTNVH